MCQRLLFRSLCSRGRLCACNLHGYQNEKKKDFFLTTNETQRFSCNQEIKLLYILMDNPILWASMIWCRPIANLMPRWPYHIKTQ